VLGAELDPPAVGVAQALHELAHHDHEDPRVLLEEGLEIDAGDDLGHDRVEGHDAGRPGLGAVGQGGQLADELPRPPHGEQQLLAARGRRHHFHPALADHENVVAVVALEEEHGPPPVGADAADVGERDAARFVEQTDEGSPGTLHGARRYLRALHAPHDAVRRRK
jgi:hypothetical protein